MTRDRDKMEQISIVILSGGKSSRMGRDKAMLSIDGISFTEHLINNFTNVPQNDIIECDEILFSVRNENDFPEIGLRHIADIYPGCGPLAGIHSALRHIRNPWLFVVACDTPFVTFKTLQELYENVTDHTDAVVPVEEDGRVHVLCGLYHKDIADLLEQQLESGNYRARAFLSSIDTNYVPAGHFSDYKKVFCNINTPADYKEICK